MIKIDKILFPTDFSELSLHSLKYARSFAKDLQAWLHVLHVVDETNQYWMAMGAEVMAVGPPTEELVQAARQQMDTFRSTHLADLEKVVAEVRLGRPFLEIIRYAREQEIDLIVMATHGRGAIKQVLLGSTADKVIRKAPCPVLSIRHPEHEFVMP